MKFDINGIVAFALERNRDFIEDPNLSPQQLAELIKKHEAGRCGGACGLCKIDQDAAAFVIADNAAHSLGKVAVPLNRTVH